MHLKDTKRIHVPVFVEAITSSTSTSTCLHSGSLLRDRSTTPPYNPPSPQIVLLSSSSSMGPTLQNMLRPMSYEILQCSLCPTSKMFFLPKPNDLLVNIAESCSLEQDWGRVPGLQCYGSWLVFSVTHVILLTDWVLQAPIGGKIVVLSSTLTSVAPSSLKNREDPKILGTSEVSFVLYLKLTSESHSDKQI